jgi:GNAT superfamily N-acetyltransferase
VNRQRGVDLGGRAFLIMGVDFVVRMIRGGLRRLVRRVRIIILTAPENESGSISPPGCRFIRISAKTPEADPGLIEEAMRAADEPDGLVASRLAHGDECFGWLVDGRMVSFGWVTYRDRKIGFTPMAETPERAFLFNFYTLSEHRGRGLYPALLLAIRRVLGREHITDFVVAVLDRNLASIRGIEKAGFLPIAQISYFLLLDRWCCCLKKTLSTSAAGSLFPRGRR